jgi:nucleotide-binding universal stress UspA family protein
MFKKILVPLDRSALAECVLPHVVSISKAFQSRITLLTISDTINPASRPLSVDPLEWQIKKVEDDAYIQNIKNMLVNGGLEVEALHMEGDAADNIVELCRSTEIDLVILSSHGSSGLTGWNVSSVVHKVVQRVHTSIMIIRAYQPISSKIEPFIYKRILVPLDGSQRAEHILHVSEALVEATQAELVLVFVLRRPEMPSRTPLGQTDVELAEKIVERNRLEAENYFENIQDRMTIATRAQILIGTNIIDALQGFIEEQNADLVLLNAHGHGYSGQTVRPYGSLALNLIEHGTTPLLVLQDISRDDFRNSLAEKAAREEGER